jgi:hypothetical protein
MAVLFTVLQLRNLQSLVEIGVDKKTTVVFPAPLMSTIGELAPPPQPALSPQLSSAEPVVTLPARELVANGGPVAPKRKS